MRGRCHHPLTLPRAPTRGSVPGVDGPSEVDDHRAIGALALAEYGSVGLRSGSALTLAEDGSAGIGDSQDASWFSTLPHEGRRYAR